MRVRILDQILLSRFSLALLHSSALTVLSFTGLWLAVVDCNEVHWAVLGGVNSYFFVYSPIFGMVTNKQPTNQPGDPRASLLLTV